MRAEIVLELAATERHLREIRDLAHAIWREHYPGIITPAQIEYMLQQGYSVETLSRELAARELRYDRATIDGRLVGFSAHGPHADSDALMLHKLYVDAAFRKSGCARKLVEAAMERARNEGRSCVLLRVNKRNRGAISAYERIGFRIEGSIVTDIGGGFEMDDHAMKLDV